MGSEERYLLAAVRTRVRSVAATISYGVGVAAQIFLQRMERVVALEAAKNSRLVVVVFNYFYLSGGPGVRGFAETRLCKKSYLFSEDWRFATPMKIKVLGR